MKHSKLMWASVALLALTFASSSLKAQSIGINFYDSANTGNQTLTSTDVVGAGAGSTAGWYNNIDVGSSAPTGVALTDNSNTGTTASLTFTQGSAASGQSSVFFNGGTNNSDTSASLTPTQEFYNGYIETLNGNFTTELALNSIPYASYSIYVYMAVDQFHPGEVQLFSTPSSSLNGVTTPGIQEGSSYYYNASGQFILGNDLPTGYTQATSTDPSNPTNGADYVLYSGLTGGTQYVDITAGSGGSTSIAGIEIVDTAATPEPSTWALVIGGFAFLVVMQRRKSKV